VGLLKTALDVATPAIVFTLLMAVGLDLTPADFARVRRAPMTLAAGLVAPLLVLPAIALALVWWFRPDPAVEAGLLLVAACPIGGISNTYSYVARASTSLSVTLTGLSSVVALAAIPVITRAFEGALQQPLRVDAPVATLLLQLVFILLLPVSLGMYIRRRWSGWASARAPQVRRLAFVLLGALLVLIIAVENRRVTAEFHEVVLIAAVFVTASFAVGWAAGAAVRASRADRFTLAAEFATRNVAVATAIAVTVLGRTDFAVFASLYFLTELPLMLAAAAAWKRWQARAPSGS
jgi:bile acid:Na+ symporter, BASS family